MLVAAWKELEAAVISGLTCWRRSSSIGASGCSDGEKQRCAAILACIYWHTLWLHAVRHSRPGGRLQRAHKQRK